jgi:transcriptional regulator with XRE-family HTH domain
VSTPIAADSPRRLVARRFAVALDRAVRANGATVRGLARASGISRTAVHFYLHGETLPSLETAGRLADALGAPALVAIAAEGRSGTCQHCARPFTSAMSAGNRRYCTESCRIRGSRQRYGVPARDRAIVAERTAARYVDAVAAYCRACEPEATCRTPECPLRVVSPLPIARRRVA